MKFTKLHIENFLAITTADINLADRGLILIQGVNTDDSSADSNGAGKSSLADALCWALFGTTARGVSGDDVINDTAGKGTLVSVEVMDGADVYTITRHRKHKTGKNSLKIVHTPGAIGSSAVDLTKGTEKLTQEIVDKVVGASLDVFKAAIYAGQEQMPDLPAMTDKHLKILIEEASGVMLLEEAYTQARSTLANTKATRDQLQQLHDTGERELQWVKDQIVTTTASRDAWELQRNMRISAAKAEVTTRIQAAKELEGQIAAVNIAELDAEIAAIDKSLGAVSDEGIELGRLTREHAAAEAAVSTIANVITKLKQRHEAGKTELAGIQHKIGCPCDECGRPLTEAEMAAAKAAAQKKLDDIVTEHSGHMAAYKAAQIAAQEALQRRDAFQASMTDVSKLSTQRGLLQVKRDRFQQLTSKRQVEVVQAKRAGELMKEIANETNPHLRSLSLLEAKSSKIAQDIQEMLNKVLEATNELDIAEAVVRVFSPAGVRAHILDEVTPFLNQQTTKYLSTLSDGNIEATWTTLVRTGKGELREKFSIEAANDKGAKSFAGLSGGEKRKVRVATALALQDLVATRATKPIDLFIGDEIDDALDQAGLERLTQILEEKATERGSVFVISHNSLRDWISNVIQVEKRGGQTIVTEMTS